MLSATRETAVTVGARRGRPVVLLVNAAAMAEEGHQFFQAANGVWLTARVPAQVLANEESPPAKDRPARPRS